MAVTGLKAFILNHGAADKTAPSLKTYKYIVLKQISFFFSSSFGRSRIHTAGNGSLNTQRPKMKLNSPFSCDDGSSLNEKEQKLQVSRCKYQDEHE